MAKLETNTTGKSNVKTFRIEDSLIGDMIVGGMNDGKGMDSSREMMRDCTDSA